MPAANDYGHPGRQPCTLGMSVFELAIYMRISRATVAHRPSEITATLMHWFDCDIDPRDVEDTCRTMVGKGWLIPFKDGLRATLAGRRAGSLHLRGLVRMMDMGTKMLDVVHWLTWLRIAGRELDGDRMEEDLGDPTLILADDDEDDDDEPTQEGRSDG